MSQPSDPTEMLSDELRDPIQAVGAALAKHGYAELTTKKIAAESSKSEAALFRHFDSKDALIEGFLEFSTDWFRWVIDQTTDDDFTEWLVGTCEVLMGDVDWELYPGFFVGIHEVISHAPHKPSFQTLLAEYHDYAFESIEAILEKGIHAGEFKDHDPVGTAVVLYTLSYSVPWYRYVLGMDQRADTLRAQTYQLIETTVLVEGTSIPRQ